MKHLLSIVTAIIFVGAATFGGHSLYQEYQRSRAYNVQNCKTPVMHLDKANTDVCLEPAISAVYLTFNRATTPNEFAHTLSQVKGVDLERSITDDEHRIYKVVYWMAKTNDGEFINNLAVAINNPALYKNK